MWWTFEVSGMVLSFAASATALAAGTGPAVVVGVLAACAYLVAAVLGWSVSKAAAAAHATIAAGDRST